VIGGGSANLVGYAVNTTTDLIWNTANSAWAQANAAYDYANTIVVPSLDGYAVNTTVDIISTTTNSAFNTANSATTLAQAAFDNANTKFNLSGGTISGNVTVTGNTNVQHVIPTANIVYDLGAPDSRFRDLYLSGNTIVLGGATISAANGTVQLPAGTTIGGSSPSVSNADIQVITNSTTITDADLNKTFIIENTEEITITLPDTESLSIGFTFEMHLLGGDENGVLVEVGNTENNILKTGSSQYYKLQISQYQSNTVSELESTQLKAFLTPTRIKLQEYIPDTHKFKFICISNTTFLISK
jgi:hypothetical protein